MRAVPSISTSGGGTADVVPLAQRPLHLGGPVLGVLRTLPVGLGVNVFVRTFQSVRAAHQLFEADGIYDICLPAEERVVDVVCDRWKELSYGPARRQSAADAGALPALVAAMRLHTTRAPVQASCWLDRRRDCRSGVRLQLGAAMMAAAMDLWRVGRAEPSLMRAST